MKRMIFDNVVLKQDEKYILMNLFSFRRECLSKLGIETLGNVEEKLKNGLELSDDESMLYNKLVQKRQIIQTGELKKFEEKLEYEISRIPAASFSRIMVNLSYKCNFDCDYCYQQALKQVKDRITIEKVDAIYHFLERHFESINQPFVIESMIISGGEPLLGENIEVINYILRKFENNCQGFILYTNGVNIHKFANRIDFSRFSRFQISIDGLDDILKNINHYHVRQGLDEILEGVRYLTKFSDRPSIRISTMLTKDTAMHYGSFLNALEEKEISIHDDVELHFDTVANYHTGEIIDSSFYTLKEYIELIKMIKEKYADKRIFFDPIEAIGFFKALIIREENTHDVGKWHTCKPELLPGVFSPEGNVYWCLCTSVGKGIIGRYYPDTYVDMTAVNQYKGRTALSMDECKKCVFRYVCGGGCPVYNVTMDRELYHPNCLIYKNPYFLENMEEFIF